jgi:hypothetical protein
MAQKHVIFLLHGMGIHETGWEKEFITSISLAYSQYPVLSQVPIAERFKFVPITYDGIFRGLVNGWANNAAIIAKLDPNLGSLAGKLTSWLAKAGTLKDNPVWTHAVDVLLYRGIRLVRERVCTNVAAQILTELRSYKKAPPTWSVIAHSLGTAVIHDTFARMTAPNEGWPGKLAFDPKNNQAAVIAMVANVSKVLEIKTVDEPYDAYGRFVDGKKRFTVAPGFAGHAGRICTYYINLRHKLDPFTVPSMFDPQNWPDAETQAAVPPRYQYYPLKHVHQANVHDFAHYLKNPEAHVPLLRALTSPDEIPEPDFEKAKNKFPVYGSIGEDAAIKLQQKLIGIAPALGDEWEIIGDLWAAFLKSTGVKP